MLHTVKNASVAPNVIINLVNSLSYVENIAKAREHYFQKVIYHCYVDLLFDLLGFSSFAYVKLTTVKVEVSCIVILPIRKHSLLKLV